MPGYRVFLKGHEHGVLVDADEVEVQPAYLILKKAGQAVAQFSMHEFRGYVKRNDPLELVERADFKN